MELKQKPPALADTDSIWTPDTRLTLGYSQEDLDPAEDTDAMPQILSSSVSYRIAVGPQQERKAFMIRTIRPIASPDPGLKHVGKANGFSPHAGVSCEEELIDFCRDQIASFKVPRYIRFLEARYFT